MRRPDILWVIVSPCPSHTLGIFVVRNDVVVIREFFVADCAFPVLLHDLSVQQLPYFCWRPEFPIHPWMNGFRSDPLKHSTAEGITEGSTELGEATAGPDIYPRDSFAAGA